METTRVARWVAMLAGGYALAALLWFTGTPLGQVPVVDSHQQVALAQLMADGALPAESFHRAPLYPAILSLAAWAGAGERGIYLWARALNAASLFLLAWGASRLAGRWQAGPLARALVFAGVAANPVLLFYAGFAFDILPASVLGLWGFALAGERSWRRVLLAGLCFSLAAQLRSHFLPVALVFPVLVLFRRTWLAALCAALPLAAALGLFALANHAVSGEWRLTPWQGAYSLYVGNGPLANGRYYVQSLDTGRETPPHENPAKAESILLYESQSGRSSPHTIGEMNRYWVTRTREFVQADPLRWLRLMAMKTYALLNNHEQYDNLTYSLHKEHSPWLRWNPLGWGLLMALALAGLLFAPPRGGSSLLVLCAAYAAGILLFYPTSRFRIPLYPLLAALGACGLEGIGRLCTKRLGNGDRSSILSFFVFKPAVCILGVGVVFSAMAGVNRDPGLLQDHRILAYAALRANQPDELELWLTRGLQEAPRDPVLLQIKALQKNTAR